MRARKTTPGTGRWILYLVVSVLGALASLFVVLVPVAHAVWAWAMRRRMPWRRTAVWSGLAVLAVAPWALLTRSQSAQVDWIGQRSPAQVLQQLVVQQYTYGDDKPSGFHHGAGVLGIIGVLGLYLAALVVVVVIRRRRLSDPERQFTTLAGSILIVPLLALLGATVVGVPMYVPRYLSFTVPFAAVLVVVGARHAGRWGVAALAIACVCGLALQAPMRQLIDRPSDDYRTAADDVAASGATAYLVTEPYLSGVAMAYPDQFRALPSLSVARSELDADGLYPELLTPAAATAIAHGRIAVLAPGTDHPTHQPTLWYQALEGRGCHQLRMHTGTTITTSTWDCP